MGSRVADVFVPKTQSYLSSMYWPGRADCPLQIQISFLLGLPRGKHFEGWQLRVLGLLLLEMRGCCTCENKLKGDSSLQPGPHMEVEADLKSEFQGMGQR